MFSSVCNSLICSVASERGIGWLRTKTSDPVFLTSIEIDQPCKCRAFG